MQAGRIVEQGRAEAVLQHPQHDYTRTLLAGCTTHRDRFLTSAARLLQLPDEKVTVA